MIFKISVLVFAVVVTIDVIHGHFKVKRLNRRLRQLEEPEDLMGPK